jgi:outer membrane lipoprotein SlyB
MFHRRIIAICVASVALAACASPTVDTTRSSFDEQQYTVDLDNCRGGTALDVALDGLGGAVVGSAFGAFEGAIHGAWSGNSPEGAAIGAVVGGVVGVVVGAKEPFEQQEQNMRRCLSEKGYVLES